MTDASEFVVNALPFFGVTFFGCVPSSIYVGSDHARNKVTRRSRTGYMIFCNMALSNLLAKAQLGCILPFFYA